jgi:hypothetical protein
MATSKNNPVRRARTGQNARQRAGVAEFEIDPAYFSEVIDRREWGAYDHIPPEELTAEQVMKILRGLDRCSSTGSRDHPEFAALRDRLEAEGFIECQRQLWNGDRVLRPFRLNGARFKRGEQFACGVAIRWDVEYKLKQQQKGGRNA